MYNDENKNFIIGQYVPDGKLFDAKNRPDTNLYKFLDAIAKSFVLFEEDLQLVFAEMNPATTQDLITRWEQEYGMSDSCFGIANTLEERRNNLLCQIDLDGIQTIQDFLDLASKVGVDVNITPGIDFYTFPFTVPRFPVPLNTVEKARFTMVVDLPAVLNEFLFPYDITKFPIPFGSSPASIIECLFNKLVPASVAVIYRFIL